jgi:hypothetical protein
MNNVFPLYPNGIPHDVLGRLAKISVDKRGQVKATGTFADSIATSIEEERQFLHNTLNDTLAALHTMSVNEKYETFAGLSESMKDVFDLYINEKLKGN